MTKNERAALENTVEQTLQDHGYLLVGENLARKQRLDELLSSNIPKRYSRQVDVGTGIYGTILNVDFYIVGTNSLNSGIIIECKSQQTSGSVDEKLPYLNLNIQNGNPAKTIVLIDGKGIKQGAIDWLKAQVDSNPNLLAVHSLSSFMDWAKNTL